jgi:16S rRNA (guanine527-N7)-methyltransferase
MPILTDDRIAALLAPYLGDFPTPPELIQQLSTYLDLLLKWNARTNLTAIREPEAIVQRHFGESLFAGVHLASRLVPAAALLDLGSGAGFPGLPIQLLLPGLHVTLAESQNKKASFLREAVRTLGLPRTEVWAGRAEDLPAERTFAAVTVRAVDNMPVALAAATPRLQPGGVLVSYMSDARPEAESIPLPLSGTFLVLEARS